MTSTHLPLVDFDDSRLGDVGNGDGDGERPGLLIIVHALHFLAVDFHFLRLGRGGNHQAIVLVGCVAVDVALALDVDETRPALRRGDKLDLAVLISIECARRMQIVVKQGIG